MAMRKAWNFLKKPGLLFFLPSLTLLKYAYLLKSFLFQVVYQSFCRHSTSDLNVIATLLDLLYNIATS